MNKKKLLIIAIVCTVIAVAALTYNYLARYLITKDEKVNFLESYDAIEMLYKEVMMEDIIKNNDIEYKNESLYELKDMYEDILEKSTEIDDPLILAQVMIINDYFAIDNEKYYKQLDDYYIDSIGLLCLVENNYFEEENDMESAIDLSTLLIYYYNETDVGKTINKKYNLSKKLEEIYNNIDNMDNEYLKNNKDKVKARIADVFIDCNIENNINMTEVKSEFEEDLQGFIRHYGSKSYKLDLEGYSNRNVIEKYEKLGFDEKELVELKGIVDGWNIEDIKKDNWGIKKPVQLSVISGWIIDLRREQYKEDNILKNEEFASQICDGMDEYSSDCLVPQFTSLYEEFTQKKGTRSR